MVSAIISSFINAYPNKQLLDYSYKEQWLDIIPALLISIAMGGIVYLFNFINIKAWMVLVLQVLVGILIILDGKTV